MKISWMVLKLQCGHDFKMDRRTDDCGKNNMAPNPEEGRHNKGQGHSQSFSICLFVCVGVLCPSQQLGHVELVR